MKKIVVYLSALMLLITSCNETDEFENSIVGKWQPLNGIRTFDNREPIETDFVSGFCDYDEKKVPVKICDTEEELTCTYFVNDNSILSFENNGSFSIIDNLKRETVVRNRYQGDCFDLTINTYSIVTKGKYRISNDTLKIETLSRRSTDINIDPRSFESAPEDKDYNNGESIAKIKFEIIDNQLVIISEDSSSIYKVFHGRKK